MQDFVWPVSLEVLNMFFNVCFLDRNVECCAIRSCSQCQVLAQGDASPKRHTKSDICTASFHESAVTNLNIHVALKAFQQQIELSAVTPSFAREMMWLK